ncbi:hypothetical protein M9H77_27976 [Catharanthus roseus]|uniref:Uncharacterized protein n=1 Tax=Catharanthus roseus TaxID=4058 RepID=A0ACC0AIB2_CATRO|nr:hypothetical protein M9H77_27976 [Catharanthus roseus]
MWKLKLSENDDPWLKSTNNHLGREYWEFDPNLGTVEERSLIERVRDEFRVNRFMVKHSSDLLMLMQLAKENPCKTKLPRVKLRSEEKVTKEAVEIILRRALGFYSTIQAEDGHWPGDWSGPLFLLPGLIISLHVMDAVETILSEEHQREICRYLFNHQPTLAAAVGGKRKHGCPLGLSCQNRTFLHDYQMQRSLRRSYLCCSCSFLTTTLNGDGGWGLHIEGHSTMFGTALNYVSLRLLGEKVDGRDGDMEKARKWIIDHGGLSFVPSWVAGWFLEANVAVGGSSGLRHKSVVTGLKTADSEAGLGTGG